MIIYLALKLLYIKTYVAHLLVPEDKLKLWNEKDKEYLLGKVERAIRNFGQSLLDPKYDWDEARKRVNTVLKEINVSLPNRDKDTDNKKF